MPSCLTGQGDLTLFLTIPATPGGTQVAILVAPAKILGKALIESDGPHPLFRDQSVWPGAWEALVGQAGLCLPFQLEVGLLILTTGAESEE